MRVVFIILPLRTLIVMFGRGPIVSGGDQHKDEFDFDTTVAVKLNGLLANLYTELLTY